MLAVAVLVWLATGVLGAASAAPARDAVPAAAPALQQGEAGHAQPAHGEGEGGAHESEGLLPVVARLVNFLVLVAGLGYLLRAPFAAYLERRGTEIRRDLVEAEEMRAQAGRQIAELDAKLVRLPAELDALRARGAEEVAAEEARIRESAARARERLLEQMRREIDLQVRVARQTLMHEAAHLAIGVAAARIRESADARGAPATRGSLRRAGAAAGGPGPVLTGREDER